MSRDSVSTASPVPARAKPLPFQNRLVEASVVLPWPEVQGSCNTLD
nr:MAG TPA: hypothetical protein [Inoviridae sp.]